MVVLFLMAEKLGKLKGELREAEDALVKALAGTAPLSLLRCRKTIFFVKKYAFNSVVIFKYDFLQ